MPSKPPKPQQAPFQQQQQTTNTYGVGPSISGTQEAQDFLNEDLDYGDETSVDPGVGRRTALAEQEAGLRSDSALSFGVPGFLRRANQAREVRDIQAQGAYEAQNAQFLNQQGNNQRRAMTTEARLARRERLLPQILQTGGSGSTSGFQTQFPQSQPGFWQRAALSAIGGGSSAARMYAGGGG